MLIRHSKGDVEYAVACMSPQLRGENVIHVYMAFNVRRFSESRRSSARKPNRG